MSLFDIQEASYVRADGALRGAWPAEQAMGHDELEAFLAERTYCVLATVTPAGRPQARPVAFTVFGDSIWFATVAGGRLRNLERTPWVSVVIAEGEGDEHRAVAADGPVTLFDEPPDGVLELWERRFGSRADWAAALVRAAPGAPLLVPCLRATPSIAPPRGCSRSSASARGRVAAPARAGGAGRRAARRPAARVGRGGRQEPRPALRGRRRPPLAPADERPLDRAARAAARREEGRGSILRGEELEGVLWGGPVLELHTRALARLGPDILGSPPDFDAMLARLRRADGTRTLGETLQDQSLVAGIGNMWMAETLWHERLSPWLRLADVAEADRRRVLESGRARMRAAVDAGREPRKQVYRACRPAVPALPDADPCRAGQGDANRTAYWCPTCQPG